MKEDSEKSGLKLDIQKTKIMASGSITSWQIDGENTETGEDFIFFGSEITVDSDCSHEIKRHLLLGRKTVTNLSSVQSLSCVWLFVTPWAPARQASLFITISQSLLKLMSVESVMPSNRLILCHPLLLLPSLFPSIRVFSNESVLCIRWPKYWSFSFSISLSSEYSGLISFRMDWLDLLAVQGTLKSLLQHHSSKASIPWCSAFFIVQLSHLYMTTGKTIALTRQTNLDSVLKSRGITLPTKVHLVKAMVFPVVMYGCKGWTIKKAECWRIDAFELWYWRRLESPLDCKEIKPVSPKGNQPWIFTGRTDAEAEAPTLWPTDEKSWLIGKDPDAGKDWRQEKGVTEDELLGWHHQFNGYEFE